MIIAAIMNRAANSPVGCNSISVTGCWPDADVSPVRAITIGIEGSASSSQKKYLEFKNRMSNFSYRKLTRG
jgi:hypothetical protein